MSKDPPSFVIAESIYESFTILWFIANASWTAWALWRVVESPRVNRRRILWLCEFASIFGIIRSSVLLIQHATLNDEKNVMYFVGGWANDLFYVLVFAILEITILYWLAVSSKTHLPISKAVSYFTCLMKISITGCIILVIIMQIAENVQYSNPNVKRVLNASTAGIYGSTIFIGACIAIRRIQRLNDIVEFAHSSLGKKYVYSGRIVDWTHDSPTNEQQEYIIIDTDISDSIQNSKASLYTDRVLRYMKTVVVLEFIFLLCVFLEFILEKESNSFWNFYEIFSGTITQNTLLSLSILVTSMTL